MSFLFYYLILKPLSWLPLSVTYYASDFMYLLMYRLTAYRKAIVLENIAGSFPDKSSEEHEQIASDFYRFFCDMIFESIRLFSIPEKELLERCKITNKDILKPYAEKGQSVLAMGAHYASWEIAVIGLGSVLRPHRAMGIYSPLKNKTMDKLISANRSRMGTLLTSRRKVKEYYEENKEMTVDIFVADQSPSNAAFYKLHWTPFLNRTSGFVMGPERYAVRNDIPVFYLSLKPAKRGHIVGELIHFTDKPRETAPGEITEFYARTLERTIQENPVFWLWTHRRWKRGVPAEVPALLEGKPYLTGEYER